MKTQIEKLVKNIENHKAGIYKSYYLEKSNAISNDKNEVVFAYKNGRGTGYISVDGVNHKMYIPDNFFENKAEEDADLSIYIGDTTHYIGEESGLLHSLYAVRFEEILNAIEVYEQELEVKYAILDKKIAEEKEAQKKWQEEFDKAKPYDLINTRLGYCVRKKDYDRIAKYGYDGIDKD